MELRLAALLELLATGLRCLEPDGRLTPDPAGRDAFDGAASLFVVDLEMSGPNAQVHEVLDVGGVRCTLAESFPEEEAWGIRVKPKHIGNAVPGALKVVGYTPREWKNAVDLEHAFERFAALGRDAVITGWGIGQDMAFLAESFRRLNEPWPFALVALDVQPIARAILGGGQVDRFNLGHVADRLGIGRMGEHGALADAYATYDVLVKLVERSLEA
ncbi:MAG: 3'-5' exonuclease [Dehalococcoidia bacterium]|nr:3'-5' exonuclease [Dehalococcoidia bacterium]